MMPESEKKGRGRPRKYASLKQKNSAEYKAARMRKMQGANQSIQRHMADQQYKTHAREIIDGFIDILEFKDNQPVVYKDSLWRFHLLTVRAKAFRKINLGGAMSPIAISERLDLLRADYLKAIEL